MIIDRLEDSAQYRRLHPGFDAAFDLLRSTPFEELKPGRHEVMGDSLYLVYETVPGVGRDKARLEAHRKYIDVQLIVPHAGAVAEEFGWRAAAACSSVAEAYNESKDLILFADRPDVWLAVPPGHFAVFFPQDAHAPLAGQGEVCKAIVKIAVDW